ncbi:hypothetical protein FRC17_000225 [Serendipita sp. 399]|nr:hypothetical protein FRC17_000225 [Serendipita sp. 399]
MSRWRAAPPSSGAVMDWERSARVDTTMPYNRISHYSSPLSLSAYRLISPSSESPQSPLSPQSPHDRHSTPSSPRPYRTATQSPTLPFELYRQIVQYVASPHDLCTLARVSRSFQAEAERVLYQSLDLRHHIKTLWRCETLATQPRLARYVRKLSIIIDQYTPLDSIARALQACRNLRSLTLRGAPWSDYSRVLDAVSSTEIRELTCHARGEAGVVRFLERQRCLELVDLEAHAFDMDNLSPQAAVTLQSFTGCLITAAKLVPGRPVRQLTLISDMANDATIRAVSRLAEGQGDIQALDIRMGVLRNPISWTILESVLTSLRGLRFLAPIIPVLHYGFTTSPNVGVRYRDG